MAVYFKFKSQATFDTLPLDTGSQYISVGELKQAIIKKKKIDKNNGLVLNNAQTNEEYKEDTQLIQRNTSVIVRLVPIFNQFAQSHVLTNQPNYTKSDQTASTAKPTGSTRASEEDFGPAFWDNAGHARREDTGSEEDKIKAIINQAADIPVQSNGRGMQMRKNPPVGYVCYRCNQPGHFIYDCPTNGDPNFNVQKRPRETWYGVPKSFLAQNGTGFEFRPNENEFTKLISISGRTQTGISQDTVPKELTCPICKKLLNNAVIIPCCSETTCDDCIRSALLNDNFTCPLCSSAVVPDQLIPNKAVRRTVENYKMGKPLTSEVKEQPQQEPEVAKSDIPAITSILEKSPKSPTQDGLSSASVSTSLSSPKSPLSAPISSETINKTNPISEIASTNSNTTDTVTSTINTLPANVPGSMLSGVPFGTELSSIPSTSESSKPTGKPPTQGPRPPMRKGKGYAEYNPYMVLPYYDPGFMMGYNPSMMNYPPMSKEFMDPEQMRRYYDPRYGDYYRDRERDYYERERDYYRDRERRRSPYGRDDRYRDRKYRSRSKSPRSRDHKDSKRDDEKKKKEEKEVPTSDTVATETPSQVNIVSSEKGSEESSVPKDEKPGAEQPTPSSASSTSSSSKSDRKSSDKDKDREDRKRRHEEKSSRDKRSHRSRSKERSSSSRSSSSSSSKRHRSESDKDKDKERDKERDHHRSHRH